MCCVQQPSPGGPSTCGHPQPPGAPGDQGHQSSEGVAASLLKGLLDSGGLCVVTAADGGAALCSRVAAALAQPAMTSCLHECTDAINRVEVDDMGQGEREHLRGLQINWPSVLPAGCRLGLWSGTRACCALFGPISTANLMPECCNSHCGYWWFLKP